MEKEKITYHNKDVMSKTFGERLKDKSLKVYNVDVPKIIDVRPTNLPAVEANELRIDNLFVFEDGTVGIIDYESKVSEENYVKYLGYAARITKRWYEEYGLLPQLRIIIIYTADVDPGSTKNIVDLKNLSFTLDEGFLRGVDGDAAYNEITEKIDAGERLSDEDIMKIVILPLTYAGREAQKEAVGRAIELADRLDNDKLEYALYAGILTFTDKIISKEDAKEIKRRIKMTKIEMLYEEEKQEALEKNTKAVTQAVTQAVTKEVTKDVTYNLIFKLVSSGDLAREVGMKQTGLSDEEFSLKLKEYQDKEAAIA